MKLLSIFPSTERGGLEEYALRMMSAIRQQGWDVHVAFPQTERTASLIEEFQAKNVHYHRLEIAEINPPSLPGLARHLPWLIRTSYLLHKLKPDVVEVEIPNATYCLGVILACALLQVPTAVRFHLVPFQLTFTDKRLKLYAWARNRKQQWIAVSDNNRKLLCESFHIPDNEVIRIYNGTRVVSTLDTHNNEDIPTISRQVRQELGLTETNQIVLTVGRLSIQKGYSDLVPVIPHVVAEFPEVRFVWIGDGEERDNLIKLVRKYDVEDKVLLLGYRSDVPRFLKAANLFVFPTHYEGGQSFAIAEAMAYGLPIVTSDASGIPEVIRHKVHGLLFRTGDSCDLLEATRWALKNPMPMQEMAENAQLRIQEFTEEKMVQETLEVFQQLSIAVSKKLYEPA